MRVRPASGALAIDVALKAALVSLLVFAAARQDLPQFHNKSMTGRAIGYPLAVTAILWELLEYVTFIRHSPELATAYHDTLGDLALGLLGSVVAGLLVALLGRPARVEEAAA